MQSNTFDTIRNNWILSGQMADELPMRQFHVDVARFTVGRKPDASLSIHSSTVSREHAELTVVPDGLLLRDLGSTNGTFVNGSRVNHPCTVHHGDLVQFGHVVFRVVQQTAKAERQSPDEDPCDRALALIQFDQLLTQRAVTPHFQPIVTIYDRRILGYEVLGRSRVFGLKDPRSMFAAAKVLQLETELSRVLREEGIRSGKSLPCEHGLFVNTHPVELDDLDLLVFSLHELRELEPRRPIILEIREGAVLGNDHMNRLRAALKHLTISLAYDDFAAREERLQELAAVPPDYLKFDMRLSPDLASAPSEQQNRLAKLVKEVRDLGIVPLAEGVESPGEDAVCRQMGFDCAQGFYYGFPALPETIMQQGPLSEVPTHRGNGT